jgi:hypothetical protein
VKLRELAGVTLLEWTDPAGVRRLDADKPCTLFRAAGVVDTLEREGWRVKIERVDEQTVRLRAAARGEGPYR